MGQIASLRAETRVFHDGRGAAPCRRQRSGFETVGDVRVAHRQVDVGMGVDSAGHDHATGHVHDFRSFRLLGLVQPFAEFQNPVAFNQDVRVEDAVRARDQPAGNKHTLVTCFPVVDLQQGPEAAGLLVGVGEDVGLIHAGDLP